MSEKTSISFLIREESIFVQKLSKDENLIEIRKILGEKLSNDSKFLLTDGSEIDTKNEGNYQLSEIIKDDKVYIKIRKSLSEKSNHITETTKKKNEPIPGSIKIKKEGDLDIYLYPRVEFNDEEKSKAIIFMVVGETGCGKTTLLNSLINYILGIQLEDNFRYKIFDDQYYENEYQPQWKNQVEEVVFYNIKGTNVLPPIQIIDTPGFGDIRGIQRDMNLKRKICDIIKNDLESLNSICFCVKSNNARLTARQKYFFNSILDLFGEDIKENFLAMITFCDAGIPQVVSALEDPNCVFSNIIPYITKPYFYKFNNSAIFSSNRE